MPSPSYLGPYIDLMDRILAAHTEEALRALVQDIREFVAFEPATRFDFGETWSMQWSAHVPGVVPPELWNN